MSQLPPPVPLVTEHAEHSFTLPSHYYLDPLIYEQEKEAIFYRGWHYLGHASQFASAGDFVTTQIADESVFVIRGDDGALRGFYNVCRHRAHQLLQDSGHTATIVCPYHAWSYAGNGELRYARNTGQLAHFSKTDHGLVPIRVELFCGFVFINLDNDAVALATLAADLEQDIRAHIPYLDQLSPVLADTGRPASMAANWKIVLDNFLECYHCSKAHPAFADLIDMHSYQLETRSLWSRQLAPHTRPLNGAYQFAADAPVQTAVFWYLWPTTTFGVLPGQQHFFVSSIRPLSIDTTYRYGHFYTLANAAMPEHYNSYVNNVIVPEDIALCESVQRGLKSRSYQHGRFVVDNARSGISEHGVHQFHRLVLAALAANQ
jgi:phenylpropionate dioxygenase-like ring-hydroxylating dioxygenase large terminal subunit